MTPNQAGDAATAGAPEGAAGRAARRGDLLRGMDLAVDVGFAVLLLVCGVRYFNYHPFGGDGTIVLLLALGTGVSYAVAVLGRRPAREIVPLGIAPGRQSAGLLLATACWLPLAVLAPSFGWCAFALFFAVRRVVSRRVALAVSALLVIAVSAGLFNMSEGQDLGLVLGPFFGGLVLSYAHAALDRALAEQQRLIAELVATREQLARSERDAGALAERSRVAGELHDTVVQRTASALLLLETEGLHAANAAADGAGAGGGADASAADGAGAASGRAPGAAAAEAREELREALVETRQLMHGLTNPRELAPSFAQALRQQAETAGASCEVVGAERPVEQQLAHALQRVVREALLNARKHARATEQHVTLTFFPDAVGVDVADNGVGFVPPGSADADPERAPSGDPQHDADRGDARDGGFGLRAMAWRVQNLGGEFSVDSAPGQGTVVGALLPDARRAVHGDETGERA